MATMRIEIDAGSPLLSHSRNVPAAHLVRFADALRAHYGTIRDGSPPAERAMTDGEVFARWSAGIFDQAKAITLQAERRAAGEAAADAVAAIDLS